MVRRILLAASFALALAACQEQHNTSSGSTRHLAPIPPATLALMASKQVSKSDPILMRSFKKESEIELWKRGPEGKYALLKTYPICRWSGQLGPKVKEGDRQAPEGFYTVTPAQMNPNSSLYLSFNLGFPNEFDRVHNRTGSHLMVHGSCSSRGCFAMTDEAISEVYAIAREAFAGGQRGFQFQSYPFRMTAENLAKHRSDPNFAFWRNLKEGSDHFEITRQEPPVTVVDGRYAFPAADQSIAASIAQKQAADERKMAEFVAKGTPAIKLVYEDGSQHASFREAMVATAGGESGSAFAVLDTRPRRSIGDVSRPEALAQGPREIIVEASKPKDASPRPTLVGRAAKAPGTVSVSKTAAPAKESTRAVTAAAQ